MDRLGYFSGHLVMEKIKKPMLMKKPHTHEAYELFFLVGLTGKASITIQDETFPLLDGCLVLIDSNVPHMTNYHEAEFKYRYLIEIHPQLLASFSGTSIHLSIPDFFRENSGVHYIHHEYLNKIETLLDLTYDETLFKDPYYEELALLRVLELLLLLNRNKEISTQRQKKDASVDTIIRYIIEHVTDELSLEGLAQHFFIEKSHLAHRFKRYTGQTVHEFINMTKIGQAKRLLVLQPTLSTKEITQYLGFRDTSYFCKIFKKFTGMNCGTFRKKLRQKQ